MKRYMVRANSDCEYGEYKKGDIGFIDGYCQGGNDVPYICIVFENGKIVLGH